MILKYVFTNNTFETKLPIVSGDGRLDVLADLSVNDCDPDAARRRLEVLPLRRQTDVDRQSQTLAETFQSQTQGRVQTFQRKKEQVLHFFIHSFRLKKMLFFFFVRNLMFTKFTIKNCMSQISKVNLAASLYGAHRRFD